MGARIGSRRYSHLWSLRVSLTEDPCVKVACTSSTGEHDLVADKELDERGSYLRYGAVSRAATGFISSRDARPERMHGRIARLDELLKINFDKTFGLLTGLTHPPNPLVVQRY